MALEQLQNGVRRIVAPNPSALTLDGTCCYVLGRGAVAVIDPGPADPGHVRALLAGLDRGERVEAILVTHAHLDHSPAARLLATATGAPVYGFGPPEAGRSAPMARLAAAGMAGGGEGVDAAFRPDRRLAHGAELAGGDWAVTALHTPGHFGNHLAFAMGDAVFTGDLVMGWASTLISPPDGDLGDYFRSLDLLARWQAARQEGQGEGQGGGRFYPGHGAPIARPAARLAELVAHRRARSAQILDRLAQGPAGVAALVAAIYTDTAPALHPAAARNVFAHLVEMKQENLVAAEPDLHPEALFRRC